MMAFQPEQMPSRFSLKPPPLRIATLAALLLAAAVAAAMVANSADAHSGNIPVAAAAQAEPKILAQGQAVQGTLRGGDTHAYRVDLQAGDFLHVVADQRGIDVVLAISGPDGKDVGSMDSLNGSFGPENVSIIAAAAGTYRIEVRSFDKNASAGQYEIRVTELRPSKAGDDVRVRAEKTYAQGLQLYQGDQAAATSGIPILQQALKDFQTAGEVHGQAASLYGLAAIYQKLGTNNDEAKKEFEESIRLYKQDGAKREEAEVVESFAGFQRDSGATDDADASFRKALELWEKANGTDDLVYARMSAGLGRLLLVERKYPDAEPYFQKAIAIREKLIGPESLEVADVLQSYGVTLHDQRKYAEAEPYYRRAIAIRTKVSRPDDPVTATLLNNLAVLFDDQHNPAEAEKYYRASLRIRETALPAGDSDKISTMENLIRIYRDEKKLSQAELLQREAYEDVKKAKGEESKEAAFRLDALSFLLVEESKFDEALKNFERTLVIRKKILEPKDPDIATSTSNIAFVYFKKEDYPPGIEKESAAIQLYIDDLGDKSPVLADHYAFLANLYYHASKYDEAVVSQNRAVASLQNAKTPEPRTIGVATNNLGLFLKAGAKYKEAVEKFQDSIALLQKAKDRPNEATARHNLGNTYEAMGDFPAAQDCYRQAVIIEQELGDKANEADTLLDLAGVLARQRQAAPALDTYRSALAIEHQLGNRGLEAYALNGIADLYKSANQYDKATETYLQAVNIREDLYPNSNGLAETFANLAEVYKAQGKYSEAEAPLRRVVEIRQKNAGDNSAAAATALNALAAVLNSEGKFPEAEPLFRQAIGVQEKLFGAEDPRLAAPLANLAGLYADQGQYAEAERLYGRALKLTSKVTEENQTQIADELNSLSTVYRTEGRYLEAARSLSQAIGIEEKVAGTDATTLADAYSTLADLYKSRHQYIAGAEAAEHALKLLEQDQGKTTALYAKTLDSVAELYELQGKHDEAATRYAEALAIQTKFSSKDSPDLALTADALAEVYLAQYKTQEAEPLLLRALAIREKVFGPNHPRTSDTVQDLALLYYYESKRDKALEFFRRREEILRGQLTQASPGMSDKDRKSLLNAVHDFFPDAYSFAYANRESDPALAAKIFDLVLWQKALALGSVTSARHRAIAGSDPEATALLEQLASKRAQLAAFVSQKHADSDEWRAAEEKLADASLQLEREFTRRVASRAAAAPMSPVTWTDVKKQLQPGDAAIEYLRFDFDDAAARTRKPLYVALVLTPDSTAPALVTLGDVASLEAEPLRAYRASLAPAAHPDSKKFYEAFWKPLEPAIGSATHIYLSPGGALDQISFGVVTASDGKPLAEKYDLRLLPTTRDLARAAAAPAHTENTAILVGNPDFAMNDTQYRTALAAIDAVAKGIPPPTVPVAAGTSDPKGGLALVPATGAEVESASKLLREKNWQVQLYVGPLAVEEAVKGAHGPRVLHIATPGFYLPQSDGSDANSANELPAGLDDPALRSGLYFAGVNSALTGAEPASDVDDGILSAYETAALDLKDTELVVLSSSPGKAAAPNGREAIFNLPRAMLRAGAASVLAPLWSVPDKAAADFTALFYQHWLAGDDKFQSLRKTQMETRAKIIQRTGKDDPSIWGAWVLIGR